MTEEKRSWVLHGEGVVFCRSRFGTASIMHGDYTYLIVLIRRTRNTSRHERILQKAPSARHSEVYTRDTSNMNISTNRGYEGKSV